MIGEIHSAVYIGVQAPRMLPASYHIGAGMPIVPRPLVPEGEGCHFAAPPALQIAHIGEPYPGRGGSIAD